MIDLDDLKDAMGSPPDFTPRSLDLGPVMAAGGRLRRRRRLASGAAGAVAVLALLVGGAQIAQHAARPAAVGGGPAQAASPVPTPEGGLLGDVIGTGLLTGTDEWVFYAQSVEEASIPRTHFGIMLGRRLPSGVIVAATMANESEGSDRAPGFHATQGGAQIDGRQTPTFGYYVGQVARITATANGRTVTANRAVWSEDSSVTVFWFDPGVGSVRDIRAYDKGGKAIPGTAKVSIG